MNVLLKKDIKKSLIIAIDGPAGAGKSSTAKALAARLSYLHLNTGLLYRAIAWKIIQEKVDLNNISAIQVFCDALQVRLSLEGVKNEVWIDKVNVSPFLHTSEVAAVASLISALPPVRKKLLSIQQEAGLNGGIVAEGRDIGTVVFPKADLKFYLDADAEIRGKRRYKDLLEQGIMTDLSSTKRDLETRDLNDSSRKTAPLTRSCDAILIDTTDLSPDEVIEKMLMEVEVVLKRTE